MNIEDLKEQLKNDFAKTKERFEESAFVSTMKDRYANLNPISQKLVIIGSIALISLIILSMPFTHLETSSENISQFESKRALMRDLLRVQKEISDTPEIAIPPPVDNIRSRVESDLQAAQLLPEQMKGVNILPPIQSNQVKSQQNEGVVEVNLGQLNLKQIVDLGYQFQAISPSVKLKDLIVQAHASAPGYFDVIYRLLVLKVTPEELPPTEEPPKKKGKR